MASSDSHVVYVINIPKSNTAHQASDKRYYRRYNFESVAMEDYEIKDIINRLSSPDLHVVLSKEHTTFDQDFLKFPVILFNKSKRLAKYVKLTISFNDSHNYTVEQADGFSDLSDINSGRKVYASNHRIFIYNGTNTHVGFFLLRLNANISSVDTAITIFCDNMFPATYSFEIKIINNLPQYIVH